MNATVALKNGKFHGCTSGLRVGVNSSLKTAQALNLGEVQPLRVRVAFGVNATPRVSLDTGGLRTLGLSPVGRGAR